MQWSGGCLCGNIRFTTSGEPILAGICHCRNCQRHTGSGFLGYGKFRKDQVDWTGDSIAVYASSSNGERSFCSVCGSTLSFSRHDSGEISIAGGLFDDPNLLNPAFHIFVDRQCNWAQAADGLPKYGTFPPQS